MDGGIKTPHMAESGAPTVECGLLLLRGGIGRCGGWGVVGVGGDSGGIGNRWKLRFVRWHSFTTNIFTAA